jgi:hypothetical protein
VTLSRRRRPRAALQVRVVNRTLYEAVRRRSLLREDAVGAETTFRVVGSSRSRSTRWDRGRDPETIFIPATRRLVLHARRRVDTLFAEVRDFDRIG